MSAQECLLLFPTIQTFSFVLGKVTLLAINYETCKIKSFLQNIKSSSSKLRSPVTLSSIYLVALIPVPCQRLLKGCKTLCFMYKVFVTKLQYTKLELCLKIVFKRLFKTENFAIYCMDFAVVVPRSQIKSREIVIFGEHQRVKIF